MSIKLKEIESNQTFSITINVSGKVLYGTITNRALDGLFYYKGNSSEILSSKTLKLIAEKLDALNNSEINE